VHREESLCHNGDMRCAIVVPGRFELRRTDGSVGATPTGRRRYGGRCATHRRLITKKLKQNLHNHEWLCHNGGGCAARRRQMIKDQKLKTPHVRSTCGAPTGYGTTAKQNRGR
jgi:hypothetical protein